MQLCPQVVPSALQDTPVFLVVGALEDNRKHTYAGPLTGRRMWRIFGRQHLLPQASQAINPADLLFDHPRVPFGMQQHHRATGPMTVGAINHPQSNLADLYRELGDIFAVPLRPHNRWGGFKALRERWLAHLEGTRRRAVLLIDEAQEMSPQALCELRLLASARFDSQPLLCVVLAGDARLIDKLRREELIPLGSRIRTRLATEHASRDELLEGLGHLLAGAGNASLMTAQLRHTLCDHAAGNYRILTTMAAELLAVAAQRELPQLDEKLYLEVFAQPEASAPRRAGARR